MLAVRCRNAQYRRFAKRTLVPTLGKAYPVTCLDGVLPHDGNFVACCRHEVVRTVLRVEVHGKSYGAVVKLFAKSVFRRNCKRIQISFTNKPVLQGDLVKVRRLVAVADDVSFGVHFPTVHCADDNCVVASFVKSVGVFYPVWGNEHLVDVDLHVAQLVVVGSTCAKLIFRLVGSDVG